MLHVHDPFFGPCWLVFVLGGISMLCYCSPDSPLEPSRRGLLYFCSDVHACLSRGAISGVDVLHSQERLFLVLLSQQLSMQYNSSTQAAGQSAQDDLHRRLVECLRDFS